MLSAMVGANAQEPPHLHWRGKGGVYGAQMLTPSNVSGGVTPYGTPVRTMAVVVSEMVSFHNCESANSVVYLCPDCFAMGGNRILFIDVHILFQAAALKRRNPD
jgi:hypothetical protein